MISTSFNNCLTVSRNENEWQQLWAKLSTSNENDSFSCSFLDPRHTLTFSLKILRWKDMKIKIFIENFRPIFCIVLWIKKSQFLFNLSLRPVIWKYNNNILTNFYQNIFLCVTRALSFSCFMWQYTRAIFLGRHFFKGKLVFDVCTSITVKHSATNVDSNIPNPENNDSLTLVRLTWPYSAKPKSKSS